jgi:hypothetical protein
MDSEEILTVSTIPGGTLTYSAIAPETVAVILLLYEP